MRTGIEITLQHKTPIVAKQLKITNQSSSSPNPFFFCVLLCSFVVNFFSSLPPSLFVVSPKITSFFPTTASSNDQELTKQFLPQHHILEEPLVHSDQEFLRYNLHPSHRPKVAQHVLPLLRVDCQK